MQNILKRKNMQKYFVKFLQGHLLNTIFFKYFNFNFKYFYFGTKFFLLLLSKSYVLDHSGSFSMHIKKKVKTLYKSIYVYIYYTNIYVYTPYCWVSREVVKLLMGLVKFMTTLLRIKQMLQMLLLHI